MNNNNDNNEEMNRAGFDEKEVMGKFVDSKPPVSDNYWNKIDVVLSNVTQGQENANTDTDIVGLNTMELKTKQSQKMFGLAAGFILFALLGAFTFIAINGNNDKSKTGVAEKPDNTEITTEVTTDNTTDATTKTTVTTTTDGTGNTSTTGNPGTGNPGTGNAPTVVTPLTKAEAEVAFNNEPLTNAGETYPISMIQEYGDIGLDGDADAIVFGDTYNRKVIEIYSTHDDEVVLRATINSENKLDAIDINELGQIVTYHATGDNKLQKTTWERNAQGEFEIAESGALIDYYENVNYDYLGDPGIGPFNVDPMIDLEKYSYIHTMSNDYEFSASKGQTISVKAVTYLEARQGTELTVVDESGNQIASGSYRSGVEFVIPSSGKYIMKVDTIYPGEQFPTWLKVDVS